MLWRRQPTSPYLVLERFAHPSLATDELHLAMLHWGDQRGRDVVAEQASPLTVYTSDYTRDTDSTQLLARFGFTRMAPNPDEHNVYFVRSLADKLQPPDLPPGYTLRPLEQRDGVEVYQSLYGFTKVNPQHQKELLASDEYCHQVVVNPQGDLVAYGECSVCRAEWHRTSQRIGWIEFVGTRPEHKNKGLGRAALLAGLARLKEWGANTAILVTVNTNTPAISLYHKTGFEILEIAEYPSYEKKIELL
jgi:mycothiol synthase